MFAMIYTHRTQYLIILPGVVLLFLFNYVPMAGIQVVFRDFRLGPGRLSDNGVFFVSVQEVNGRHAAGISGLSLAIFRNPGIYPI